MVILKVIYNLALVSVLIMGCESMYLSLKKWVRKEDYEGKTIIHRANAEYFDVFVIILLVFLFIIIINRAGWMEGPILHYSGDANFPDDRTPADYLR